MTTAIILGAGSTLSEGQFYRRTRSYEHPPLDATFFGKALELQRTHQRVLESVVRLRRRVRNAASIADPWEPRSSLTLEQFFADVYYDVASQRDEESYKVYLALLQLYGHVLGATTNWIALHSRPGQLVSLMRREIAEAGWGNVSVISFNQDLVMESVARRIGGDDGRRWCLDGLYGDPKLQVLHFHGNGDRLPGHSAGCVHDAPFKLFKLHGSMNWFFRSRDREPGLGSLFPRSGSKKVYAHDNRHILNDLVMTEPASKGGRSRWYTFPLVVPPIYDKQRITAIDFFDSTWSAAATALEEADKLVVFGYSVPESDVLARQLLRRAFNKNAGLHSVDVINPDAGLVPKLRSYLNCLSVRYFDNLGTYLATERREIADKRR